MKNLIGITGRIGAGKTTAGQLLTQRGYAHYAFAAPLKAAISTMLGVPYDAWEDREWKHNVLTGFEDLELTPRGLAQTLGTEWARDVVTEDFWIRMARREWLQVEQMDDEALKGLVLSDVRFDNEAEFVKSEGGIIIEITRLGQREGYDDHESEGGIDPKYIDATIDNDATVQWLLLKLEQAILRNTETDDGQTQTTTDEHLPDIAAN